MKTCETCKHYELGKPNAIIYREGVCHRYPESLNKMKSDYCGEHGPKVGRKPSKTTKKPHETAKNGGKRQKKNTK
jgi:hypothetical protein